MTTNADFCCLLQHSSDCFVLTWGIYISYNLRKEKGEHMKKFLIICTLALVGFGLSGCGQIYDREPVGIGYDNNELKLSPCACILVYQA